MFDHKKQAGYVLTVVKFLAGGITSLTNRERLHNSAKKPRLVGGKDRKKSINGVVEFSLTQEGEIYLEKQFHTFYKINLKLSEMYEFQK